MAQTTPDPSTTASIPPISPTAAANAAVATTASIPASTDSANYASSDDSANAKPIFKIYQYFLLLALVLLIFAFVYWYLTRRRSRRMRARRNIQQSLLAQNSSVPLVGRTRVGGWRFHDMEPRVEGLNERGEPPPPYLKKPDPVHQTGPSEVIEMHDLARDASKPPDYEEGSASR